MESHISVWFFFLCGMILRITTARAEARHLFCAREILTRENFTQSSDAPSIILERTRLALGAVRLARLVSLLILVPSIILLGELYIPQVPIELFGASTAQMIRLFAIVILFTLFIATVNALCQPDEEDSAGGRLRKTIPSWLLDDAHPEPALIVAGASIWETCVNGVQSFLKPFGLVRPYAQLFERDGELVMAVGPAEIRAQVGAHSQPDAGPAKGRGTSEKDMIRAIQRFDQTRVREVMRPLNHVTAVSLANLTTERFLALARRTGYTRFPCYYDQITNLVGTLNIYDFLDRDIASADISKHIQPPLFIPEIARVDVALKQMQRARVQLAICFDEFGGCCGLLSREDILEEITGEIMDEYDRPEVKIQPTEDAFLVDGTTDLDDLRESVGIELEKDNCDTLAGYILQKLNRLPRRGEVIEEPGWRLEVTQLEHLRVHRVRISPARPEGSTANPPKAS